MGTGNILAVPSPYGSIQAAIDAASAIDTVLVSPGTYNENITLKNGVVVMSSDGRATTTISSGTGAIVTSVGMSDLTLLDGFTVSGQGTARVRPGQLEFVSAGGELLVRQLQRRGEPSVR